VKFKRFVVSCLLAGSLLGVFAGGAGAAANPDKANCVGQTFSTKTIPGTTTTFSGQDTSAGAREFGGIGQFISPAATTNCGTR
jgi:hypothetical protein